MVIFRSLLARQRHLPRLREWLEGLVGPLAHFAIGDGSDPPPRSAPADRQHADDHSPPVQPGVADGPEHDGKDDFLKSEDISEPFAADAPAWVEELPPVDAYDLDLADDDVDVGRPAGWMPLGEGRGAAGGNVRLAGLSGHELSLSRRLQGGKGA